MDSCKLTLKTVENWSFSSGFSSVMTTSSHCHQFPLSSTDTTATPKLASPQCCTARNSAQAVLVGDTDHPSCVSSTNVSCN